MHGKLKTENKEDEVQTLYNMFIGYCFNGVCIERPTPDT